MDSVLWLLAEIVRGVDAFVAFVAVVEELGGVALFGVVARTGVLELTHRLELGLDGREELGAFLLGADVDAETLVEDGQLFAGRTGLREFLAVARAVLLDEPACLIGLLRRLVGGVGLVAG